MEDEIRPQIPGSGQENPITFPGGTNMQDAMVYMSRIAGRTGIPRYFEWSGGTYKISGESTISKISPGGPDFTQLLQKQTELVPGIMREKEEKLSRLDEPRVPGKNSTPLEGKTIASSGLLQRARDVIGHFLPRSKK